MAGKSFRSGLERQVARQLELAGIPFTYEVEKVAYVKPAKPSTYIPDFVIETRSGKRIIVESKGRFLTEDRQKHRLIKQQHPELDIRFVFSNSAQRISKVSQTTYAKWCETYGFQYADKFVPPAWFDE